MSFQRVQDVVNKKTPNTNKAFRGMHYGYGATDQPDEYGIVCDFDTSGGKLDLRDGKKKNQGWGYPGNVNYISEIRMYGVKWAMVLINGTIVVYKLEDLLNSVRKYYTVDEIAKNLTVSDLTAITVNDLISGGGR